MAHGGDVLAYLKKCHDSLRRFDVSRCDGSLRKCDGSPKRFYGVWGKCGGLKKCHGLIEEI
jgi:hypothetical protein